MILHLILYSFITFLVIFVFILWVPFLIKFKSYYKDNGIVVVIDFSIISSNIINIIYSFYTKKLFIKVFGKEIKVKSSNNDSDSSYYNTEANNDISDDYVETLNNEECNHDTLYNIHENDSSTYKKNVNTEDSNFADNDYDTVENENYTNINKDPNSTEGEFDNDGAAKSGNIWQRFKNGKIYFLFKQKKLKKKIFKWFSRLLKSFIKIFVFSGVKCTITASTATPALTGILFGFFSSLENIAKKKKGTNFFIKYNPVFDEEKFDFTGDIEITTSIYKIIRPVFTAFFYFPYISLLIVWLKMRKKGFA